MKRSFKIHVWPPVCQRQAKPYLPQPYLLFLGACKTHFTCVSVCMCTSSYSGIFEEVEISFVLSRCSHCIGQSVNWCGCIWKEDSVSGSLACTFYWLPSTISSLVERNIDMAESSGSHGGSRVSQPWTCCVLGGTVSEPSKGVCWCQEGGKMFQEITEASAHLFLTAGPNVITWYEINIRWKIKSFYKAKPVCRYFSPGGRRANFVWEFFHSREEEPLTFPSSVPKHCQHIQSWESFVLERKGYNPVFHCCCGRKQFFFSRS